MLRYVVYVPSWKAIHEFTRWSMNFLYLFIWGVIYLFIIIYLTISVLFSTFGTCSDTVLNKNVSDYKGWASEVAVRLANTMLDGRPTSAYTADITQNPTM